MRLLRVRAFFAGVVLVAAAGACSSSPSTASLDAAAALKAAARRSVATSSATVRGAITQSDKPVVVLSGVVDFADRRDSITLRPGLEGAAYPPFDVRYVDGWSYVEIDSAVHRPPTMRAGAKWIAFRELPGTLPVPDRTLPPAVPIDEMNLPLTEPMIDAGGRIVSVWSTDVARGGGGGDTMTFTYRPGVANVAAPTTGVQTLTPGQNLYPPTSAGPTSS